jgi:hypothetical protein
MVTAASAAAARATAVPPTPERQRSGGWATWFWSLPELLPVAVAGFATPAIVMLLANQFIPALAVVLGVVSAALAVSLVRVEAVEVARREVVLAGVAVGLVIVWTVLSLRFSAENLFAQRDSATYELTARWLMDHPSLPIHTQADLFGSPLGSDGTSAGFQRQTDTTVFAQGNHLLPVLLATVGSLFGTTAMLKANVVLAGIALLAFFAIARRVVGAGFALVGLVAFAVSMPMIYVSRDTFTEPLALLFLMGGLALLYRAVESGRVIDFAAAGFVTSVAAVVRIDAYAALLSLLVVATILLAVAPPHRRRPAAWRSAALIGSAGPMVVLGYLDVSWLSPGYYHNQRGQITSLAIAGLALAGLGAVVVVIAWSWRGPISARIGTPAGRLVLGRLAGATVVVAFLVLLSRPWWMTARGELDNLILRTAQQAQGLPVDGTRLYTEYTVDWQAMYFGWPTVILAVLGYVLLLNRLIRRGDYRLLGLLVMSLSLSALYLWTPQITPDQVWAMRRYVPVVTPGLLIAALATLSTAWMWITSGAGRAVVRSGVVAACVAAMAIPWLVTRPVGDLREEAPQAAQIDAMCAAVPSDGAVLVVDESLRWGYLQTIRAYCEVPTLALVGASAGQVADAERAVSAHGRTLYVVASDPSQLTFDGPVPQTFFTAVLTRWPSALEMAPTEPVEQTIRVYLGRAEADGRVVPTQR